MLLLIVVDNLLLWMNGGLVHHGGIHNHWLSQIWLHSWLRHLLLHLLLHHGISLRHLLSLHVLMLNEADFKDIMIVRHV